MMHCTRTYNMNFEKDASYSDIQCGRKYYTRTYSKIFEFILYSGVQYDFWLNTILGRIVWFLNLYYTQTYSMIYEFIIYSDVWYDFLILYYTRMYSTIFNFILYSDVQYDFWYYTALGNTVRFLIEYYTRTYSMIFEFILYSDV